MNTSSLSLDQAPPFSAPLRFFLTAPFFGALFALGVIFLQPDFVNYKSMEVIGLLHLITIGFMGMIMLGALQQMLPVLAGAVIQRPTIIATLSHTLLTAGVVLFPGGMIFQIYSLVTIGAVLLFAGFILPLSVFALKLAKGSYGNATINGMRFAVFAGIVTVFLGVHLGLSYGNLNFTALHSNIADLHVAFGNMGWVFILVIGVSFQVVPMFYVTPKYPNFCMKWPLYITIGLMIWGAFQLFFSEVEALRYIAYCIFGAGGTAFASVSFLRFLKRKRPITDTTVLFWFVALISLFIGTAIIIDFLFSSWEKQIYTAGVLFFMGFAVSLLNGMLYKIVPFLSWFHLSSTGRFDIPTMRDFLPEKRARLQFYFHMVAYGMFLGGIFFEPLITVGGVLFLISNILLELNLFKAYKLYKETLKKPIPKGFAWN